MIDAQRAALRMPSFASSSCGPSNARVATSSDTVKPIPARAAALHGHPADRRT